MRRMLLFFVFLFLLVGCSRPSAEQEKLAEEQAKVAAAPVPPPPPPPKYYVGTELGIMGVTGTCVRFVPEMLEEGQTASAYFVHIQNASGYTRAVQVSRETWENLQPGDVIR